jgi:hypothetical protein
MSMAILLDAISLAFDLAALLTLFAPKNAVDLLEEQLRGKAMFKGIVFLMEFLTGVNALYTVAGIVSHVMQIQDLSQGEQAHQYIAAAIYFLQLSPLWAWIIYELVG